MNKEKLKKELSELKQQMREIRYKRAELLKESHLIFEKTVPITKKLSDIKQQEIKVKEERKNQKRG